MATKDEIALQLGRIGRMDMRTGERTMLTFDSPGNVVGWLMDRQYVPRVAFGRENGRSVIWYRDGPEAKWAPFWQGVDDDSHPRPVAFDWDGTLVDSAAHIVHSIQSAAGDIGLEIPSDERSRHIIGLGLLDAMEYLFPALPRARYGDLTERYRVHYLAGEERVTLFAGVEAGIGLLKRQGRMLAVATGKSRVGLTRAFGSTGLGGVKSDVTGEEVSNTFKGKYTPVEWMGQRELRPRERQRQPERTEGR